METPEGLSVSRPELRKQFAISICTILLVSVACFFVSSLLGYRVVALILLVTVSIIAIFFELRPVVTAAVLSALIWNFFFIPPRFTLSINNAEDLLMFLMYFLVALVNAVLTTRIRKMEKEAHRKKEQENIISLYNTLINSLSHELRTPISTIIAAADNLQEMADRLTEHNKYELVDQISRASFRLNRQVENLLNMSRLESGYLKPKYDWVDAKELVYEVIRNLKDHPKYRPVQVIAADDLPLFRLDHGLLFQVFHNLLHNAMTYASKYSVISVRLGARDGKFIARVEDTGNGFPEDEISRVFDKFYRLKNSGTGGTGLGLSIVKGFVECMGGTIRLSNMEPAGARFMIDLPCELSPATSEKI
jgi:two-component system, OmpR family, sensor histidine kinase KdpD